MLIHPENLAVLERHKLDFIKVFIAKLTKALSPIINKVEITQMSI